MEHPVSGMYNVVHGKGLAALTPPLFRHSYNTKPERYAAISRLLGGKDETDCAEAVECFLKSVDRTASSGSWGWRSPESTG